jgi:hypothetical protein
MDKSCSTYGAKGNAYRILVGKAEGRPRRRWGDNNVTSAQNRNCGVRRDGRC